MNLSDSFFSNSHANSCFIDGEWIAITNSSGGTIKVYNPNNDSLITSIQAGGIPDVDNAVIAARTAFQSWSQTSPEERAQILEAIGGEMEKRRALLVDTVCAEMGCPRDLTDRFHVNIGIEIFAKTAKLVREFQWETEMDGVPVFREPIGAVGIMTTWNGPVTSITKKVAAVLGSGCTAILKPSEQTPFCATIIAEAIEAAGVPAGVFNMVQGFADPVGVRISNHPDISGITLTGSVQAGVAVAKAGSGNLKRMCLELGGKSANILVDDDGFAEAAKLGTIGCMLNSGQVCFAPTRMLVPERLLAQAETIAAAVANGLPVGPADTKGVMMGPVISQQQYERVINYIHIGIKEGAKLIAGGYERPEGLDEGYFIRPTVFSQVNNSMRIAQEEIFGPVVSIITYQSLDEAVAIANDSSFGLAAHVSAKDRQQAIKIARRLRAGSIYFNGATMSFDAPFGGYKMSGQGREHSFMGIEEFLETKALVG